MNLIKLIVASIIPFAISFYILYNYSASVDFLWAMAAFCREIFGPPGVLVALAVMFGMLVLARYLPDLIYLHLLTLKGLGVVLLLFDLGVFLGAFAQGNLHLFGFCTLFSFLQIFTGYSIHFAPLEIFCAALTLFTGISFIRIG